MAQVFLENMAFCIGISAYLSSSAKWRGLPSCASARLFMLAANEMVSWRDGGVISEKR